MSKRLPLPPAPQGPTPVHVGNDLGRFMRVEPVQVLTQEQWEKITTWVQSAGDVSTKDKTASARALSAISCLPKVGGRYGTVFVIRLPQWTEGVATDNSKIPSEGWGPWGWLTFAPVVSDISTLVRVLETDARKGSGGHYWRPAVRTLNKAKKEFSDVIKAFQSGRFLARPAGTVEESTARSGVVVFVPNDKTGGAFHWNDNVVGPLVGARVFPSEQAARRVVGSVHPNAIYASVFVRLDGVADKTNLGATGTVNLAAAIALTEQTQLERALEEASIEQLRSRLEALERAARSSDPAPEGPPPPAAEVAPARRRLL